MFARLEERRQTLEQQQAQTEAADKARAIALAVEEALSLERQQQSQVTSTPSSPSPPPAHQLRLPQPHILYKQELTRCGKSSCKKCGAAGGPAHGPYWYSYQRINGKTTKKYLGKALPKYIDLENVTIKDIRKLAVE